MKHPKQPKRQLSPISRRPVIRAHPAHCAEKMKLQIQWRKLDKRQKLLFIGGMLLMAAGIAVLTPYAWRKVSRELRKQKLMRENTVLTIPALDIKTPILENTDQEVLSVAAGHFPDTGAPGSGNYCLAGHSSTIYACIFNDLKYAEDGMEMILTETNGTQYTYRVSERFIVEPNETWILGDFDDDRLTLVTCTDDGSQRQIVVGLLAQDGA